MAASRLVFGDVDRDRSSNQFFTCVKDLFCAGVAAEGDDLITAGGRVLAVTGTGPDLAEARKVAYRGASPLRWPGIQIRTDIAAVPAA